MGRPPKTAEERRKFYLRVRLTEEEDREIRDAAARSGLTVSGWALARLRRAARAERSKKA